MVNKFLLISFISLLCEHTAGFSKMPTDTKVDTQDRVKDSSSVLERLEQIEEVTPKAGVSAMDVSLEHALKAYTLLTLSPPS